MQQIILGSAGFLLYFIYDINSVRKQNRLLQKFFTAGTILVVLSLFMELWFAWGQCSHRIGRMIGFGIGAMCFLALRRQIRRALHRGKIWHRRFRRPAHISRTSCTDRMICSIRIATVPGEHLPTRLLHARLKPFHGLFICFPQRLP